MSVGAGPRTLCITWCGGSGDPGPDTGTVSRCHPPIARWGDCNERRALVSRSEWCEVVTEAWGHEVIVRIFDYLIVKNNFLDIRYLFLHGSTRSYDKSSNQQIWILLLECFFYLTLSHFRGPGTWPPATRWPPPWRSSLPSGCSQMVSQSHIWSNFRSKLGWDYQDYWWKLLRKIIIK